MVEEVRERVIRAAAYRPYEGGKRVFVIEAAEAMRDESQNALLKTLEEPPAFVHLILLSSEPEALLETIASRCQPIDFAPLPAAAIEAMLARGRARRRGRRARRRRPPLRRRPGARPAAAHRPGQGAARAGRRAASGARCSKNAEAAGEEAESATREALEEEKEAGMKRSARDIGDAAKRAGRRRRTELLDLGLRLAAAWFRDLAAVACGAADVAYNRDRLDRLRASRRRPRPERRPPRRRAGRRHPPPPRPQRLRGAGPRGVVQVQVMS